MRKGILLLIPLLALSSSCIPTIIGAAVYKSSKTREAKEEFIGHFNQTNMEREKAGLQPLDLCTEKYNYDKKWADDDPTCKERIEKYEAGDKTALGQPQLAEKEPDTKPQPIPTPGPTQKPVQNKTGY